MSYRGIYVNNLIICLCGNNIWLYSNKNTNCSACNAVKRDTTINTQSNITKATGTTPNAVELAQAQLDRLNKKEFVLNKIKDLIDSE